MLDSKSTVENKFFLCKAKHLPPLLLMGGMLIQSRNWHQYDKMEENVSFESLRS